MAEPDYIPYQARTRLPRGPVLVLAPHADDEVIGCGGAIIQHVRQGDPLTVVLATDGTAAKPHADSASREDYKATRLAESRAAAEVLGYKELRQWDAEDRGLSAWPELIPTLRSLVEALRPAIIYAPSLYEIHPDHFALAEAVCGVAPGLDPRVRLMFYEIGWPVPANLLLDITPDTDRKHEALRCFKSQLAIQDYARHMQGLNVYRTYTLPAHVHAAEAFLSLTAGELSTEPLRRFGRSRLTDKLGFGVYAW